MRHFTKIVAGLVILIGFSCDSSDERARANNDAEYVPLAKGWYQIYQVKEIIYEFGEPETIDYKLKTLVADSFKNGEGGYTYVIHRMKRDGDGSDWQNADTWSIRVNSQEVVVNENNIPYVVLDFPIREGLAWNGNAYNAQINPGTNEEEDIYTLEQKGKSYLVNNQAFEDCIVVNQEDNQEFVVYFDKRTEVYARHIGLIYKEKTQLYYCTDPNKGCIGQQKVEKGVIYTQAIQEYGKE